MNKAWFVNKDWFYDNRKVIILLTLTFVDLLLKKIIIYNVRTKRCGVL